MNNETITFTPLPKKAMTDQQFKLELSRFSIKQREERGRFNYEQHQMKLRFKASQLKEREVFIQSLKGGDQC
jgi:hypothetical protein